MAKDKDFSLTLASIAFGDEAKDETKDEVDDRARSTGGYYWPLATTRIGSLRPYRYRDLESMISGELRIDAD
jgi:hypothetical protein